LLAKEERGGEGQRASVPRPRSGPRRGGRGGVLGRKRELGCGEKKGKPGLRAERERRERVFSFSFLLFSFYSKAIFTSFQNILNHFKILSSNTLITINKMQRHACSSMFSMSYDEFLI